MTLAARQSGPVFLTPNLARLRGFVRAIAELVETQTVEAELLARGRVLLADLVAVDDWLPAAFAAADSERYQQYLLHCDSRERFSIVSFVWGPGQATPIHDHRTWGLIGVLRGAELNETFERNASSGRLVARAASQRLEGGAVAAVSPQIGDLHRVSNAYDDRASISIHVYGANIGLVERATYDAAGQPKRFVSGYANRLVPNLWDGRHGS
jgi:predicted metal-dependent enzyme (double-stranded beta helix superfamily)